MPPSELSTFGVYSLLLIIGMLGGLGDAWTYSWATSHRAWWMVAACGVQIASVIVFGLLLRWDSRAFSSAFMLSSVVHVVVVMVADILCFGGRPTPTEWAGLILATVAVVLLEVGRDSRPHSDQPSPQAVTPSSDKNGGHR